MQNFDSRGSVSAFLKKRVKFSKIKKVIVNLFSTKTC